MITLVWSDCDGEYSIVCENRKTAFMAFWCIRSYYNDHQFRQLRDYPARGVRLHAHDSSSSRLNPLRQFGFMEIGQTHLFMTNVNGKFIVEPR